MADIPRFLVIGAGSWGTALAVTINRAGSEVVLWTRNDAIFQSIQEKRMNSLYLPNVFIDPNIVVTQELMPHSNQASYVLLAVPAQHVRTLCIALSDQISRDVPLIIAAKGIERGSLMLMHEVAQSILPHNPILLLSGPNFAQEVAAGLPTATTIASTTRMLAERAMFAMGGKFFRPYYSEDLIGVQIGGAVKNVIAIACGICAGRGMGENAQAALITRGLAEMKRLAKVKGGDEETLSGLSGLGDLLLTCQSRQSRNMSLGYAIGRGEPIEALLSLNRSGLTEGVATAESVSHLAKQLGVSMPISLMVNEVLQQQMDVDQAIDLLLSRPLSGE